MQHLNRRSILIDIGDHSVRHFFTVAVPILAVLLLAETIIPTFSVDEKHSKVSHVDERRQTDIHAGEAKGEGHQQVTSVVHVSTDTPPTTQQKVFVVGSAESLRFLAPDQGVGISSELVFLSVTLSKDDVTEDIDAYNGSTSPQHNVLLWVHEAVESRHAEDEGDPDVVAPAQHPAHVL
jgi:hypothetical protein